MRDNGIMGETLVVRITENFNVLTRSGLLELREEACVKNVKMRRRGEWLLLLYY